MMEEALPSASCDSVQSRNVSELVRGVEGMGKPARRQNDRTGERAFQAEEFVPYLLRRVSARLANNLSEALKGFAQTPNFWRILVALDSRDRISVSELSAMTIIDQSTLSRTLDRMAQRRFVRRLTSGKDARTVQVVLTDAGHRAFNEILPLALAQYEWAIRGISGRDLAVLKRSLRRMLRNIRFSPIK